MKKDKKPFEPLVIWSGRITLDGGGSVVPARLVQTEAEQHVLEVAFRYDAMNKEVWEPGRLITDRSAPR